MSIYDDLMGFIGTTFVEREVEFDGKKKTFKFRLLSADEAEEFFALVNKDEKKNKGLVNRLVAMTVCDDAGKSEMTAKEAGTLPAGFLKALQEASLDANGLTKKAQDEAKKD